MSVDKRTHHLRNLLQAAILESNVLARSRPDDDLVKRCAGKIAAGLKEAAELVDTLETDPTFNHFDERAHTSHWQSSSSRAVLTCDPVNGDVGVTRNARRSILLVEDDVVVRSWIESVVREAGYEIAASVGVLSEAISSLEEQRPDLAIVEAILAGLSAQPLIGALRQRQIPYIVASGQRLMDLGGEHAPSKLLVKPFGEEALISALREMEIGAAVVK